jgi:pimeloyl-ACP methyl ester carboxylesterase
MAGFVAYTHHGAVMGGVVPAAHAMLRMNATVGASAMRVLGGQASWMEAASDWSRRVRAGVRLHELVHTTGRELFGSARFEGEQVLVEGELLRLSYLPPTAPSQGVALFHAGGGLPYSDRIFRMLPEANFYGRFLERGIGVYAMELRGDRSELDYSGLSLERLIDTIRSMSDVALQHAGGRRMILEGYCGHGMQALAYAAAHPADAESKFQAIATFVAPIDGTKCSELATFVKMTPEVLLQAELALFEATGGYVPGEGLGMGLDLALGTMFHKSPLGHFAAGFEQPDYADVQGIESLTPSQRRELAGSFWITHENSGRFPMPVDLVQYATALFTKGISKQGDIPYGYKGRGLSLRDIAEQTSLKVFGFYGGRDTMVPDRTAACMEQVFGERYKHVLHLHTGHIGYVLSPRCWEVTDAKALKPNPIDVLLAHCCERSEARA